jgi:D-beta-D-heptose 7-phosphate kinase/D-beta-D-heptose 1-phosphate adenosyltransferase
MGKVLKSWQELSLELGHLRAIRTKSGKTPKVVFTNGCFDILHVGHIRYLQEAKSLGDVLVVGLNTDASVQVLKGPDRPVQNENARAEIMAALACVDFVTLFGEETPELLIREVQPDVLVKGGDWSIDKIAGASFVQSYGGEVKSLQFADGFSTTSIIDKINRSVHK